jgi:Flp pilus assembly secretin CpaC
MRAAIGALVMAAAVSWGSAAGLAATPPKPANGGRGLADVPTAAAEKAEQGPYTLVVTARRSKLLRTKADTYRTEVDDPAVCSVVQFTPRSLSVLGKRAGTTGVTVWLRDGSHRPVQLLVHVIAAGSR